MAVASRADDASNNVVLTSSASSRRRAFHLPATSTPALPPDVNTDAALAPDSRNLGAGGVVVAGDDFDELSQIAMRARTALDAFSLDPVPGVRGCDAATVPSVRIGVDASTVSPPSSSSSSSSSLSLARAASSEAMGVQPTGESAPCSPSPANRTRRDASIDASIVARLCRRRRRRSRAHGCAECVGE